ncbi:DUF2617 family protein [Mycolicibacterium thermoresistibile]|uniref:DUF2617 domain-containing protein n=2 Tax=Mycolicibacterium thermoresistibile TaxID=1797 RepID=G7CMM5_MYCT3|nr:DUF2617 family protein [Mycolicibacterium thermoresistibile]EHI10728.1 hypothetical protein KEK_21360 [Mycolicibacterium thermoresistibile ATCC 19527]MCV7189288.1 DUF2617 family protein [Mycolicibacterium thermoresistibile]GAT16587.1 conserved protein of unknown function [Mycolicibacterium thermoresistibile]SNW17726.1 Conserved protein of uncharacterised function with PIN domain, possible toxin [Mycolicibacterium thermoresistibile]
MPFFELAVTPTDVSGEALGLALNAPAPRPLAGWRLRHPRGGELRLGVLGASHVVTVEADGGAGTLFSEQVSCAAHSYGGALPGRAEAAGYRLESRTSRADETSFRELARELRDRCARDPAWLGGAFPGDDAALTVLTARPDGAGWRWRTWHLYPAAEGGTVVYTSSRWTP